MKSSAVQMPQVTDRDLVDRARDGDLRAFGELASRHQRRLYRLALHVLREETEAEDFTQEAFRRMHGVLDRLDARTEPSAWLSRILVNLALQGLRVRRGEPPRVRAPRSDDPRLDGIADHTPSASDSCAAPVDCQLYAALAQAIDDLDETRRITLVLVCIDGRSHAEAAEILGASETAVASRVLDAERRLQEALATLGYDSAAAVTLEPEHVISDEPSDQPDIERSLASCPWLPAMGTETELGAVLERWPCVSTERRDWRHFAARVEARIALTKRPERLESVGDEQLLAPPLPEVGFKDFAKPAGQARPPGVAQPSRRGVPAMTGHASRGDGAESAASYVPAPPMVPVSVGLVSGSLAIPIGGSAPTGGRRGSSGGLASLVGLAIAAVTFYAVRTEQAPEAARMGATIRTTTPVASEAQESPAARGASSPTPADTPGVDPMTLPRATAASETSGATPGSREMRAAASPGATVEAADEEAAPRGHVVDAETRSESAALAPVNSLPIAPTPVTPPSAATEVTSAAAPSTGAGPEDATNERPSQGEVMSALAEVLAGARDCLSDGDSISRARVVFGSDGTVQSVTISGFALGKPAEGCIRAALGEARVSSFKDATYGATVTVRP